jgi:hypothetical protein
MVFRSAEPRVSGAVLWINDGNLLMGKGLHFPDGRFRFCRFGGMQIKN